MSLICNLPILKNIIEKINPLTRNRLYDDNASETILFLIDEYIKNNINLYSRENFNNILFNAIYDLLELTYAHILNIDENNIIEILNDNIEYYFSTIRLPRSYPSSTILTNSNRKQITTQLQKLNEIDEAIQIKQNTNEWFEQRYNLLTASSIWKCLDTQSNQNNLIMKKCSPLKINKSINIKSPMHWGHKYEPISSVFYEHLYKTKIKEYGCISHNTYKFLGASPDGINIDSTNERYGRMLEIKNIVNREITGIPKKEYWIQMQMQMEVCNLDECDFLETRFKEYESEEDFLQKGGFDSTDTFKGVIICFHSKNGPVYKYSPFPCNKKTFDIWYDKCIEENIDFSWVKNIYWYLDEYSCVLVCRQKDWFNAVVPKFTEIWNTILHEREHGYEHRLPKRRAKKSQKKNIILKVQTESFLSLT